MNVFFVTDCFSLADPVNGKVVMSEGTRYGARANYSCNPGYHLLGTNNRTCTSDGIWSPNKPFCVLMGKIGLTNKHLIRPTLFYDSVARYCKKRHYTLFMQIV